MPTLSVVIVTHNSAAAVAPTLLALSSQLREDDELIVVDNASSDGTVELVRELPPRASVIETGANLGFATGCNVGAEAASGDLLCLLNPDAAPAAGWRDAVERPLLDGNGWAAWQALVTENGGQTVNTHGGVVHFTGIAWAGGAGDPIVSAEQEEELAEPGFVSGACLLIPRDAYVAAGGMPDEFFLYHEDVDLSLRLRLAGGRLGVERAARVDHDYDFAKGLAKWEHLGRNRWATMIRTYPASLLVLLAPALAVTEVVLLAVAATQGWLPQKVRAWGHLAESLRRLLGERRAIQRTRTISVGEFARALTPDLSSAYLGAAGRSRLLAVALRGYWRVVLLLLGARRGG